MKRAGLGVPAREPDRIRDMFGRISGRYDLMNTVMTAGLDYHWRKRAAAEACLRPGDRALDVCCGTGDLAIAVARRYPETSVVGLDFSEPMLDLARAKAAKLAARGAFPSPPEFLTGDTQALPFAADEFAAVTVAFGVRNVSSLEQAFAEMHRVTRPGGCVICLEISTPPPGLGRRFHEFWFERCVPVIGGLVAGDRSAYRYLPASVRAFPQAVELAAIMTAAGFKHVCYRRFGLGIVALHTGVVPESSTATWS